jgi:hypothetical protein
VPLVEQELLTLPEHMNSPRFLVGFGGKDREDRKTTQCDYVSISIGYLKYIVDKSNLINKHTLHPVKIVAIFYSRKPVTIEFPECKYNRFQTR